MKNFGVYILESCKTGRYYIGSSADVENRLKQHNDGKVFSTKGLRPWILKVFIKCLDSKSAKASEYRLKKYKRKDILNKVISDRTFPWNHTLRS